MNQISLVSTLIRTVFSLVEEKSNVLDYWERIKNDKNVIDLVISAVQSPFYDPSLDQLAIENDTLRVLPVLRRLRACYSQPIKVFTGCLVELSEIIEPDLYKTLAHFNQQTLASTIGHKSLSEILIEGPYREDLLAFSAQLEAVNPHALFPTSSYRESTGSVISDNDDRAVEAVMSHHTFTSIRIEEDIFNPKNNILRNIYSPLGRCICLIDSNVEKHYRERIESYFENHNIPLHLNVYRAMEVDKTLPIVERMLNDFKQHAVARNEPVLIIGGGVLADTGGLACALFNRNTPYVMIGSSIVSAIDAGPSPRTCCDGLGYKNLSGAYHAPVLTIADRLFFKTLKIGWLRHGVAEIIKMAVVKDYDLFQQLESVGPKLFHTKFATVETNDSEFIRGMANKILGGAMRSYVEAEYDNLFETHQCRPHAYGHTWSPGFELQAGLLHGHAVSIGMGLGAFLSHEVGWLDEKSLLRILRLISDFELSLWHDILLDEELLWSAQKSIIDKRGGNLVAPVPKGEIGKCGYINQLSKGQLRKGILNYQLVCKEFDRNGVGIEPYCKDVGLEDPSEVLAESRQIQK